MLRRLAQCSPRVFFSVPPPAVHLKINRIKLGGAGHCLVLPSLQQDHPFLTQLWHGNSPGRVRAVAGDFQGFRSPACDFKFRLNGLER